MTWGNPASLPRSVAYQSGKLLRLQFGRAPKVVADIGAYTLANMPAGRDPETDPNGLTTIGRNFLVADAAGNTALRVVGSDVQTVATLPARPGRRPRLGADVDRPSRRHDIRRR